MGSVILSTLLWAKLSSVYVWTVILATTAYVVAVDTVGAGFHERVLVVAGCGWFF